MIQLGAGEDTKILVRQYHTRLREALRGAAPPLVFGCMFPGCANTAPLVEIPSLNGSPAEQVSICEWHRAQTLAKPQQSQKPEEPEDFTSFVQQADEKASWMISGLIPEQGLMTWHGNERSMKSLTMLAVGLALAMGESPFVGGPFRTLRRARVLHVTEEDSKRVVRARLRKLQEGWRREGNAPPEQGWYRLMVREGVTLDTAEGRDRLLEVALRTGAEVLFIEPIRTVSTLAEGTAKEFAPIRDWMVKLQEQTRCRGIVVGAHWRKTPSGARPGTEGSDNERLAGAALKTASDGLVAFRKLGWAEHCMTPASYKTDETPRECVVRWDTEPAGEHGEAFGDWLIPRCSELSRDQRASDQKLAKVVEVLESSPTSWMTASALAKAVGGRKGELLQAFAGWAAEGKLHVWTPPPGTVPGVRGRTTLYGGPSAVKSGTRTDSGPP